VAIHAASTTVNRLAASRLRTLPLERERLKRNPKQDDPGNPPQSSKSDDCKTYVSTTIDLLMLSFGPNCVVSPQQRQLVLWAND